MTEVAKGAQDVLVAIWGRYARYKVFLPSMSKGAGLFAAHWRSVLTWRPHSMAIGTRICSLAYAIAQLLASPVSSIQPLITPGSAEERYYSKPDIGVFARSLDRWSGLILHLGGNLP